MDKSEGQSCSILSEENCSTSYTALTRSCVVKSNVLRQINSEEAVKLVLTKHLNLRSYDKVDDENEDWPGKDYDGIENE